MEAAGCGASTIPQKGTTGSRLNVSVSESFELARVDRSIEVSLLLIQSIENK